MKTFKVVQTKPALYTWKYTVHAESSDEAVDAVENGEVEHDEFYIDDEFQGEYEYETIQVE